MGEGGLSYLRSNHVQQEFFLKIDEKEIDWQSFLDILPKNENSQQEEMEALIHFSFSREHWLKDFDALEKRFKPKEEKFTEIYIDQPNYSLINKQKVYLKGKKRDGAISWSLKKMEDDYDWTKQTQESFLIYRSLFDENIAPELGLTSLKDLEKLFTSNEVITEGKKFIRLAKFEVRRRTYQIIQGNSLYLDSCKFDNYDYLLVGALKQTSEINSISFQFSKICPTRSKIFEYLSEHDPSVLPEDPTKYFPSLRLEFDPFEMLLPSWDENKILCWVQNIYNSELKLNEKYFCGKTGEDLRKTHPCDFLEAFSEKDAIALYFALHPIQIKKTITLDENRKKKFKEELSLLFDMSDLDLQTLIEETGKEDAFHEDCTSFLQLNQALKENFITDGFRFF